MKKWIVLAVVCLLMASVWLGVASRSSIRTSPDSQADPRAATGLVRRGVPSDRPAAPTATGVQLRPRPIAPATASAGSALPSPRDENWSAGKFYRFTPDEWRDMASRCELRWQLPPFGSAPDTLSADEAAQLGLSAGQRDEYNRLLSAANQPFSDAMRALDAELTGDAQAARTLPLHTVLDELRRHSAGDPELNRRLALEQAGDARAGSSLYERYLRLQLAAENDFAAQLERAFGPALATALRQARGAKFTLTGCDSAHGLFRSERTAD